MPVGGSASWGKCQLGDVPVGGSASWGKCQLGDFNLSDFLGTIFFLIHFYLMNAKNEHYFLNKINSIKTDYKVEPSFLLKFYNLIII